MNEKKEKFKLQDNQYEFPYHYIPELKDGIGSRYRFLSWGFEYLCYLLHIKELINSFSPSSVLDVGCGSGRLLGELNRKQIDYLVGVDLSEKAIRFAKAFHPDIRFRAINASGLNETFDVVTAVEVLEHIPDEETDYFLETLFNRTNSNGHIIISVPTKIKPLQDKHYRHYNIDLFKKELKSSNVKLEIKNVDYIYKKTFLLKLYKKVSKNRFWLFEFSFINDLVWDYVWNNLRNATKEDGLHMILTLKKL